MAYPEPLEGLIEAFERFPGIGRVSAERLAFHVLRDPQAAALATAIERAARETGICSVCCNIAQGEPCELCSDPERDAAALCVVEEPRHVEAMERAGVFRGRYHVLMGALNPAEGTEDRHLSIARLVERVGAGAVEEVILATDPDAEGEATALLVVEALEAAPFRAPLITRLARGLPAGSSLDYLHRGILEDALAGRRSVGPRSG
ncbi:MAG: recombination protein RecR [Planctomycetes bacterium]|nr:recombination protein RecR [Planctomycetota bacterium]MDP6408025.1 recombination mediator RecR [Planctomycetota bacterium]